MSHANGEGDNIDQGRLDLVPMIDCVMLLLLFFILTTKFVSEEQSLSSLLGTGGAGPGKAVDIPTLRIAVLPGTGQDTMVRIGGDVLVLPGEALAKPAGPELDTAITTFHRLIADHLVGFEREGDRSKQVPIEIHCASRMPWRSAIVVYDAVRGYEKTKLPSRDIPIESQRPVAFAAPTVRNTSTDNEREETYRLMHLH